MSANRANPTHRLLGFAGVAFGISLIAAAIAANLPTELLILVVLGAAMITFQATANSLLQLNSDSTFRGRVMALYVIVFVGSTPIGGPLVGWLAQEYGPRAGLGLGGLATIAASAAVLWALGHWRIGERYRTHVSAADGGLARS